MRIERTLCGSADCLHPHKCPPLSQTLYQILHGQCWSQKPWCKLLNSLMPHNWPKGSIFLFRLPHGNVPLWLAFTCFSVKQSERTIVGEEEQSLIQNDWKPKHILVIVQKTKLLIHSNWTLNCLNRNFLENWASLKTPQKTKEATVTVCHFGADFPVTGSWLSYKLWSGVACLKCRQ